MLDLSRFGTYLSEAYRKAKRFMDKEDICALTPSKLRHSESKIPEDSKPVKFWIGSVTMKRRNLSKTTISVFVVLFVVFLIHQISFTTIPSKSTSSSSPSFDSARIRSESGETTQLATSRWRVPILHPPPAQPSQTISCNRSSDTYDVCTLNGPTILDPTVSTAYLVDPYAPTPILISEKIRPYPRKWENDTMSLISELSLATAPTYYTPTCDVQHYASALIFSAGGYNGNLFHDFNDGLLPLFITTRSVFTDWDPVLVILNCRDWWLTKYAELLHQFTRYPIVNLDKETKIHCFPSATVGLISHGYMTVDPVQMPRSENLLSFRALLGTAYEQQELDGNDCGTYLSSSRTSPSRPRLVLVERTGDVGRVMLNQADVVQLAEMLGFEVIVFDPTKCRSLGEAYGLLNRTHALMGVHGGALTHAMFLRPGAVFVQVVPIGIDWLAEACFGKAAREMGLEYIEYKIDASESSLKSGNENFVSKNPVFGNANDLFNATNIYLKNQDVKLDLGKVEKFLTDAYHKAESFMGREG
ncbi:hypothetical protein Syun_023397 [Stephania yunnanensis]|uniref:Glycosyltransferase 61 catalytic domain-containing protein n=1 Tax=Stephania yunnanensis TaxID=152371 RepID=A0AAP0I3B6_9MAGN